MLKLNIADLKIGERGGMGIVSVMMPYVRVRSYGIWALYYTK